MRAIVFLLAACASHAQTLAVVEKVAGRVGFYSTDGKLLRQVKIGAHPHEIIQSPDKRYLYITDNGILWMHMAGAGGNTISILDSVTTQKVGVIDLGNYRRPHGMDIDPRTNRMVSTIENPHGLLLIDLKTRKVLRKYDVQGEGPHMVVLDAKAEYAYVSNATSNAIAVVHLESGKVKLLPAKDRPQGGVMTPDGKTIYITLSNSNSIAVIDTPKQEITGTIPVGKGPARVVIGESGKSLIYNLQAGQAVGFVDIATRKETKVIPIGGDPLSLTMSKDGKFVYAGIQDQDKIIVISVPERRIVRTIETPKQSGPDPVLPIE
jgi:YVTN family beta-propeller protein